MRSIFSTIQRLAFAVSLVLVITSPVAAQVLPVVPAPSGERGAPAYSADTLIVRFRATATAPEKLQAYAAVNGRKLRGYALVRGLEYVAIGKGVSPEQAAERLRHLPFVLYAEPDYKLQADTNDTYYGLEWGLENTGQDIRGTAGFPNADIDAPAAWSITTGDPDFLVAVIDSGTDYTHPDLANNIWTNPGEIPGDGIDNDGNGFIDDIHGWDFYSNDNDPMDENGHGTHVAGTICAEGNNGVGVTGVAWHCKIMPLRFLGPSGSGSTSGAISALDYAVAMGVKVSNNSWGGGGYSLALYDAIQSAGAAGGLFIAAAGNSGVDNDVSAHYPSSYDLDTLISVAATDNQDRLSSFSNYGATSVDIGAPGTDIASTWIAPYNYVWASGTSMAAPHVSGLAALVWGANPSMSNLDVKKRILGTARPIAALAGKTVTGGIINSFNALDSSPTGVAPDAPDKLSATATSHTEIDLSWADNASNENGFLIERKPSASSTWSQLATVGVDVQTYSDTAVSADTAYDYQVRAYNFFGQSAYTSVASATTPAAPAVQVIVANSETSGAGTVLGNYSVTWALDETAEGITERESGGRKADRYSYLQHTWNFDVPPGITMLDLVYIDYPSIDGDMFEFSYSINGGPFVVMADPATDFPTTAVGSVQIRIEDTDRTPGNTILDTVYVDYLAISSFVETATGSPPAAPTDLSAPTVGAYSVGLQWADNSVDELGFRIERSPEGDDVWTTVGNVNANILTFSDDTVSPSTTYDYRVFAFNAAGDSTSAASLAGITTGAGADILLSRTSGKDKGWQWVDLTWTNKTSYSGNYDVLRDNSKLTPDGGISATAYIDSRIGKGGATYTYQVCPSGLDPSFGACSNEVQVVF